MTHVTAELLGDVLKYPAGVKIVGCRFIPETGIIELNLSGADLPIECDADPETMVSAVYFSGREVRQLEFHSWQVVGFADETELSEDTAREFGKQFNGL